MKFSKMVVAAVFLSVPGLCLAQGQPGDFAMGAIAGSPLGLSTKWWLDETTAIDAAVGAADSELEVTGDFLWHTEQIFPKPSRGRLPVFFGVGGRLQFDEKTEVGIRFVAGAEYFIPDTQLGVFAEIVPVMDLTPDVEGDLEGGVGVRYYFSSPLRNR